METRAVARYVRISPRKVRLAADLVRGKDVEEALNILQFTPRRGAKILDKVIRSAMANAQHNNDADPDRLYIKRAFADEGPTLRRVRPRARGQAYPIRKRTSHVTVVVDERKGGS